MEFNTIIDLLISLGKINERYNKQYYELIQKSRINLENLDYLKQQANDIQIAVKDLKKSLSSKEEIDDLKRKLENNKPKKIETENKKLLKETKEVIEEQNKRVEYLIKQVEKMFGLNGH